MAIIYSYPQATPTASDLLIGTLLSDDSGENPTKLGFKTCDIRKLPNILDLFPAITPNS